VLTTHAHLPQCVLRTVMQPSALIVILPLDDSPVYVPSVGSATDVGAG
jgi:hypothetical protein